MDCKMIVIYQGVVIFNMKAPTNFIIQIQKIKKMKKLLIAALLFAGTFGYANAQSKQKPDHKSPTTSAVASKTTTTATTTPTAKMHDKKMEAKSSTVHLKANGTPDKRYKENKTKAVAAGPLKKNGTPDMRYKANKK